MTNKLVFAIPLLIAVALATIAVPSTVAAADFHHFRGGGLGFGLGVGATILNPLATSNVVCTNTLAPVPVQTTSGVYCLSAANAGTDVYNGVISTPTSPIIIAGTTFGYGGFGFHHFRH